MCVLLSGSLYEFPVLPGSILATSLFGYGVTQTGKATAIWPAVVLAVLFSHTGQPRVLLFWGTLDFGVDSQQCQMTTPPFSVVFVVFEHALCGDMLLPKVRFSERFQLSDVCNMTDAAWQLHAACDITLCQTSSLSPAVHWLCNRQLIIFSNQLYCCCTDCCTIW